MSPLGVALCLAVSLLSAGLGLGWSVSLGALVILVAYVVISLAYSLALKHVVILDVFVIAAGFMLRILAGTVGLGIVPSQWLLICGFMLALFLGFVKRCAEVIEAESGLLAQRPVLSLYSRSVLNPMIGVTASSVLITYSLYTMSPETIRVHGTRSLIYTIPLITYGIFRYMYQVFALGGGADTAKDIMGDPHLLTTIGMWMAITLFLIG